jgi:hypothetical protein
MKSVCELTTTLRILFQEDGNVAVGRPQLVSRVGHCRRNMAGGQRPAEFVILTLDVSRVTSAVLRWMG